VLTSVREIVKIASSSRLKLCLLTFKVLHGLASTYLAYLCQPVASVRSHQMIRGCVPHPQRPGHSPNVYLLRRSVIRRSGFHRLESSSGGCTLDGVESANRQLYNCSEDVSVPSFCGPKPRHARPCNDFLVLKRDHH